MSSITPRMKVALITGAAGGLGRGLVKAFASQGWHVAAGFHLRAGHCETSEIWPVEMDVTNRKQAGQVVEQVLSRWQRLDVLVNNAGLTADQSCWQMDDTEWEQAIQVNLKGAFNCCQAVLPLMLKQRDGHIINISSFSARSGQRGQSNYAAAKAGLLGLTVSMAREAGAHNIRVNAVLPGVLPTAMTARIDSELMLGFAAANVLGRISSIEEVARFIVFLSSLQNISGQVFQLDSRVGRWG